LEARVTQEPRISKELRELMDKSLKDYPYGMVCTGTVAITEPQNTIHTTFGGFQNQNELRDSLLSTTRIEKFSRVCNIFSNQDAIHFMNKLILSGTQKFESAPYIQELKDLSLIETKDDQVLISGKGRIFILAIHSLIS